jgi:LacI family transcriptional regulator
MKLTIYDIAKKANVSIATVSRAMDPRTAQKVSPETLKKIQSVIERYQYAPNLAARNLVRTSYKTVGVIFPHHLGIFSGDYYYKILCGVTDFILDTDYHFKLLMLKGEPSKWDRYHFKSAEGVDGLIVTHWRAFFSNESVLERLGIPCVVINDPEENISAHFVSGDHVMGGRLAAEHLYSQGHRKMAVFTGPLSSTDSQLRMRGFKAFLTEKGISLDPRFVFCGEFQEEKAAALAEDFFKKKPHVTALFCCNDGMAFGVLKKLEELGISCPDEISVVGYDGDKRGESSNPPLTTIDVPLYQMAKEAAKQLIDFLKQRDVETPPYGKTLFPVALIERRSVKRMLQ